MLRMLICTLCALTVSLLFQQDALADKDEGLEVYPYAAATLARISGPDEWSTGVVFGAELVKEPLYLGVSYDIHDILAEHDAYPWDSTFGLEVGVYKPAYHVLGIDTSPHAGLTLSRPAVPNEWSTGIKVGLELSFEPVFLDLGHEWHDILSEHQVYPWDGTFRLTAGTYFGETEEKEM